MAHVKKGQLTATSEWARHLRKVKRFFWHGECKAAGKEILQQLNEENLKEIPGQLAGSGAPGADLHAPAQSNPAATPGRK